MLKRTLRKPPMMLLVNWSSRKLSFWLVNSRFWSVSALTRCPDPKFSISTGLTEPASVPSESPSTPRCSSRSSSACLSVRPLLLRHNTLRLSAILLLDNPTLQSSLPLRKLMLKCARVLSSKPRRSRLSRKKRPRLPLLLNKPKLRPPKDGPLRTSQTWKSK